MRRDCAEVWGLVKIRGDGWSCARRGCERVLEWWRFVESHRVVQGIWNGGD